MRGSAPEITREDGRLRVEARSAAAALAAVTEELGTSARIVAVDKVVRGGIAGFFSRELIQVTADDVPDAAGGVPAGPRDAARLGAPDPTVVEETAAVVREHLAQRRAAQPTAHDDVRVEYGAAQGDGPGGIRTDGAVPGPGHDSHAVVDAGHGAHGHGPSSFADLLREASLHPASTTASSGDRYVRPRPIEVPQRRSPEMVGSPVAIALDRLLRAGDDNDSFGDALRRELERAGWDPRHGSPATSRIKRVWVGREEAAVRATGPVEGTAEAADVRLTGAGDGSTHLVVDAADGVTADAADAADPVAPTAAPALSVDTLRSMGLPASVLEAVDGLPGDARGAWVAAIAGSLAPLCTPLPPGDCVYVGPAAGDLVAGSDIPVATMDGPAHLGGDIAVCADDSRAGRGDVEWLRDGRWIHLVVGGGSWRWHVMSEPRAVSWADVSELPAAIGVAVEHGIALGSPTADPGSRTATDPQTLARALVELAEHRGEAAEQ